MYIASAQDGKNTGDRTGVGFFIPLPKHLASKCPSLVPEDYSSPHVTFLYVGEVPAKREKEFLQVVQEALRWLRAPVRASLGEVDYFAHADKDRRVAHVAVQFNRDMAKFRDHLRDQLAGTGFEVADSFPVYRPHVTLAYLDGLHATYRGDYPRGAWDFRFLEIWGLPKVHKIELGTNFENVLALHMARRMMAKYKAKKIDDKGNTHYEYGPRQVANRHKRKAEKAECIRKSIDKLRTSVKADLTSKDDQVKTTALAIALIDETYERVGNPNSAEDGHFGITGWKVKHITFKGGKATLNYVGKSGVKQKKEVVTSAVVKALKAMTKGKGPEDSILTCGEDARCIHAKEVNEYLEDFEITAKDIRGFHANREMLERLKVMRKDGPELPTSRKEKDTILKKEFDTALKETAKVVGHEPATLKSDYLIPSLVEDYLHDGTVAGNFKQATKSHAERDDAESERLIRSEPKKKPPRKDKRRERMKIDTDPDIEEGDKGDDPDMSLNYKRVAANFRQSYPYIGNLIGERVEREVGYSPPFTWDADTRRGNMSRKLTTEGARRIIAMQDRIATLLQDDWSLFGVPKEAAHDVAYRTDLLSAFLEKRAGLTPSVDTPGFDATEIADEDPGALEHDADEPYMKGNFTQQEFNDLREKQEAGELFQAKKKATLTKSGAAQVTDTLDRIATLYQDDWKSLGVSEKIARSYAWRLDRVSDFIGRKAGMAAQQAGMAAQPSVPNQGFDPRTISEMKSGPHQYDADEPYMGANFTQQESNELSDKQVSGRLSQVDVLPEQDLAGKLAAVADSLVAISQSMRRVASAKEVAVEGGRDSASKSNHGFNLFA